MAQKTSINIKPCNIGSSEAHNRRTAEYLARINKEKLYIHTDLMASNEAWVAPELDNSSLTDHYRVSCRNTEKPPNSRKRSAHGFVIMRNSNCPLMK